MLSVNRATILGNVTRDPEVRYTPNGQTVANFGIATNRRWKNQQTGDLQEAAEFHDIVAWGKLAEQTNQMIKKGSPVYVEGRLQTRSWEGPDGTKRYKTEIVAQIISVFGSRSAAGAMPESELVGSEQVAPTVASSAEPVPVEVPSTKPMAKKPSKPDKQTTADSGDEINLDEIPF